MMIMFRIGMFIMLYLSVFLFFRHIKKYRLIKESISGIYERISSIAVIRAGQKKQETMMYGAFQNKGLAGHMDELIKYSGITEKIAYMTTELYITLNIVVCGILFFSTYIFSGSLLKSITVAGTIVFASEGGLEILRRRRYEKIEEELPAFLNSVENYAAVMDDLVAILERSVAPLEGPLKKEIGKMAVLAKMEGSSTKALRELEDRIEHPFFKSFVRNLEISSRNSANYREIAEESRNLLQQQIENSRQLQNIYAAAKYKIVMVTAGGIICISIMGSMILGCSQREIWTILGQSGIGRMLIFSFIVVIFWSLYYAFVKTRGKLE